MKFLYFVAVCAVVAVDRVVCQYMWNCSTDTDSGRRRIPGVSYDVGSTINVVNTPGGEVNIFSVRDINETCYGEVTAIEFCYQYDNTGGGELSAYFNWTVLILEDNGSGPFTITHLYAIESRPSGLGTKACSGGNPRCCCDKQTLTRPFNLGTNFAYGVTESSQGNTQEAELLGFHDSLPQYQVERSPAMVTGLPLSVNSTVPRPSNDTRGLRLLWFVGPNDTTPDVGPSTTTAASTANTTSPGTTSAKPESTMSTSKGTTVAQEAGVAPAVGGAVGGVIVVAVITILVVVIVILAVKRKRMGSLKVRDNAESGSGYNNALYAAAEANGTADSAKLHMDAGGVSFSNVSYAYVADALVKSEELGHDYSLPTDGSGAPPFNGAADSNVYAAAYEVPQGQTLKNGESSGYEEDIYMVPASDEHTLYGQLSQIKIHTFTRDAIRLTELLGSGQFGKVHRGEWTNKLTNVTSDVAVKTLKEGADELEKVKFLQEAAIMGQFSHPNVVKLYGVITEGEPVMLIIELLLKGDLRDFLCAVCSGQSSDLKVDADLPHTLLSFCRQIASGMSYLASKAFVHRDLAARNILVSEDCSCKIADFGMSRDLADTDYYVSHGGKIPVKWTSPEALNYKKYSTASDVWSFGCVMYEIWSLGHKPFESLSNQEAIKVVDGGVRLPPPPGCPRSVYKQMIDCWHPTASSRPDFVSVVQQLSLPDTKLLKWSEEDKAIDPEAATLGAGLERATELYNDLQGQYITK